MKTIEFEISVSGMSEEMYSDKIMIYKPFQTHKITYTLDECLANNITHISDVITDVCRKNDAADPPFFGYSMDDCTYKSVYLKYDDCLLGLNENKGLAELFDVMGGDILSLVYIFVAGGASIRHRGYRFVVHSDEYVHKDSPHPHVHVIKDNVSVRYYLDSFERFGQDEPTQAHRRDERRIIKPFLRENQKRLLNFWDLAIKGFIPPTENEDGEQFYPES